MRDKEHISKVFERIAIYISISLTLFVPYSRGLQEGKTGMLSYYADGPDTILISDYESSLESKYGRAHKDPSQSWVWEPLFDFGAKIYRSHRSPAWNPFHGYGDTPFTNYSGLMFSPFRLPIYLGLTNNSTWTHYAALIFASIFTYEQCKNWRWHSLSAFASAVTFSMSQFVTLDRLPSTESILTLPFLVWASHLIIEEASIISSLAYGVAIAITALSGHPEPSLLCIVASLAYIAFATINTTTKKHLNKRLFVVIVQLIAAIVIAILLSSVAVIPFVSSWQDGLTHVNSKFSDGISLRIVAASLTTSLISLFVWDQTISSFLRNQDLYSDLTSKIWHSMYCGPTLILLITSSLFRNSRYSHHYKLVGFFWALYFVFVLLLPPFGLLSGIFYFISYYSVGIGVWASALTVGVVVQMMSLRPKPPRTRMHLVFAACVVFFVAGVNIFVNSGKIPVAYEGDNLENYVNNILNIISMVVVLLIYYANTLEIGTRRLLICIIQVTTMMIHVTINTPVNVNPFNEIPDPIKSLIQKGRTIERITGLDYSTIQGNSAIHWGYEDVKLTTTVHSCRYLLFLRMLSRSDNSLSCHDVGNVINATLEGLSPRGLEIVGVDALAFKPAPQSAFSELLPFVNILYSNNHVIVAENRIGIPRNFIAESAVFCDIGMLETFNILKSQQFRPWSEVTIENAKMWNVEKRTTYLDDGSELTCFPKRDADPNGRIKKIETFWGNNTEKEFRVDVSQHSWLVSLDRFDRFWEASVNGEKVETYIANGLFRAVKIAPGFNVIQWKYVNNEYKIGRLISIATCVVILVTSLVGVILNQNKIVKWGWVPSVAVTMVACALLATLAGFSGS